MPASRNNSATLSERPDAVLPWQLLMDTYHDAFRYLGSEEGAAEKLKLGQYGKKYPHEHAYDDSAATGVPANVSILAEILKRSWHPVRDRMNKAYFLTPYTSVSDGVKGFFGGPFMAAATMTTALEVPVLSEVARIALAVPALLEFSQGFISMIKALVYKIKGDDVRANMYFRDGATRLLLAPCLMATAVASVAIEFVRFFTRLAMTIVHAFKGTRAHQHEHEHEHDAAYSATAYGRQHHQDPSHLDAAAPGNAGYGVKAV